MTSRSLHARTPRRLPLLRTSSALAVALLLLRPCALRGGGGRQIDSVPRETVHRRGNRLESHRSDPRPHRRWNPDRRHACHDHGRRRSPGQPAPVVRHSGRRPGRRAGDGAGRANCGLPASASPGHERGRFPGARGRARRHDPVGGLATGNFTMLFRTVSTNASTKWSISGPNGAGKGIDDLATGMFAVVAVVNSGGLSRDERRRLRRHAAGALRVPGRRADDHVDGVDGRGPNGAGGFRHEDRRRTPGSATSSTSSRESTTPRRGPSRPLISSRSRSSRRPSSRLPGPATARRSSTASSSRFPSLRRRTTSRWATGRSPRATSW